MFPGDTRITMIRVPDLRKGQEIPKDDLIVELEKEAPQFLYTIMRLELPPLVGRLRIPVVTQHGQQEASRSQQPHALEAFIDEYCPDQNPDAQVILFKDFCARFYELSAFRWRTELEQAPSPERDAPPAPDPRRHGEQALCRWPHLEARNRCA